MSRLFDDVSILMAEESLPRRESLRRIGLAMTATILSPLGMQFAQAGKHPKAPKPPPDPCKAFCSCRNKQQKNQCLAACHACSGQTDRLAGGCGNYICCGAGQASCGSYCADLASDPYNCGACDYA
ncbi:MAG: hypothetical protein JNG89_10065, partial [Planctomycetaceae bacterium]|nr:hypothetical protein [Planctomycetaceae bacterium]